MNYAPPSLRKLRLALLQEHSQAQENRPPPLKTKTTHDPLEKAHNPPENLNTPTRKENTQHPLPLETVAVVCCSDARLSASLAAQFTRPRLSVRHVSTLPNVLVDSRASVAGYCLQGFAGALTAVAAANDRRAP